MGTPQYFIVLTRNLEVKVSTKLELLLVINRLKSKKQKVSKAFFFCITLHPSNHP